MVHCDPLQRGQIQEHIAVGECADQLGARYAAYTTAEAADDIDAVRRSLGLGRIFLYGDSYGTLQGQAYAVRHASKLRGLILDSAYPGQRSLLAHPVPRLPPRAANRLPPLPQLPRQAVSPLQPRGPPLP